MHAQFALFAAACALIAGHAAAFHVHTSGFASLAKACSTITTLRTQLARRSGCELSRFSMAVVEDDKRLLGSRRLAAVKEVIKSGVDDEEVCLCYEKKEDRRWLGNGINVFCICIA